MITYRDKILLFACLEKEVNSLKSTQRSDPSPYFCAQKCLLHIIQIFDAIIDNHRKPASFRANSLISYKLRSLEDFTMFNSSWKINCFMIFHYSVVQKFSRWRRLLTWECLVSSTVCDRLTTIQRRAQKMERRLWNGEGVFYWESGTK